MEKEKFNWKRFSITLAIVLITAGAVGGSVWWTMNEANKDNEDNIKNLQEQIDKLNEKDDEVTVTEDDENETEETANWKAYENNDFNFSLDYPSSWNVVEGSGWTQDSQKGNSVSVVDENDNKIIVQVNPPGSDMGIAGHWISYDANIANSKIVLSERDKGDLTGQDASGLEDLYVITADSFTHNGNRFYVLTSYLEDDKELVSFDSYFKKIIETIEFTD